jgi:uncharacterized membrane protein
MNGLKIIKSSMTTLTYNKTLQTNRLLALDVLRGCAIVLMVLFHFAYDLTVFGYAQYDTNADIEWRVFRALIVSAFLLAVGMSSYVAYYSRLNKQKLALSTAKLVAVSALISLSSCYMYPNNWVYFGIIHFIAVALPLSVLFLHWPRFSILLAVALLFGYFSDIVTLNAIWQWSVTHWGIPKHTVDLVSFIPWFALVLLGSVAMHYGLLPQLKPNKTARWLALLGRHSLLIYLLHQPILFMGFYVVQWLK